MSSKMRRSAKELCCRKPLMIIDASIESIPFSNKHRIGIAKSESTLQELRDAECAIIRVLVSELMNGAPTPVRVNCAGNRES